MGLLQILCLIICLIPISNSYPLPQKRRADYPMDQDCQLCHAIVIESVNKIGGIVSFANTRNVVNSICKISSFKGYALYPKEIDVYCNQFVRDHGDKIQVAVLGKQMRRFKESIDDHVCNGLNLCPRGWKPLEQMVEDDISDLEMEL